MSQMIDLIKKNMASASILVTFVTAVVGSAFTFESRYAKAADIIELKSYVKKQHDVDRWQITQDALLTRKQQIEDQLFVLRLKSNPSQTDKALIQRYTDQLQDVNTRLAVPSPDAPSQ